MIRLVKFAAAAICAALSLAFSSGAGAQAYPSKPIRIVVPWAPGGSTDVLARLLGQKMTESWGQPAVVDNKPGASGNIGSDFVAKAPADCYTLLAGSVSTHAMNPFLIANMPFRGVDDFATLALAAYVTNVLVAHPSVPAKNVKELIELAKSKPGAIAYASAGNGSTNHLSAELFRRMTATDMLHVPYKGGGPATTGLLGGQVGIFFTGLGNVWDHVKSGKLKLLAVTENRRSKLLPDVPMVGETLSGYEVAVWYGVWAPAGTPADIVTRLNAEVNRIMSLADIHQRLVTMGAEHVSMTVPEVGALLRGDYERWGRIIKDAGIKAD